MKGLKTKKELSPEQREELLRTLHAGFEKNMNHHEGLEWTKVKARLEANPEKLWSLSEMERTGGDRTLLVMIKRRANTSFLIVPRKVRKAAEVFATTVKHWIPGKKINRKIARWIWQPWALSF
jgi:Protein of unknown function (DUF4256)